ncbi:uncharacterized protein LODBEIA_P38530 [Lodderomyces beijingensis]|uniref:Alpha box domain-containing protein n=1 Tax=Lodderomyces beijingensis TaxID=1775926 RepID=A0ABP0ZNB5_9ASCO
MAIKKAGKSTVPRKLTSLFKLHGHRLGPSMSQAQSHVPVFAVSTLPEVPAPSPELQDLLFEYQLLNVLQWAPARPRAKKMKSKPINSFIAFRSYYSRAVTNPQHQRELSSKLGELWSQEPRQEVWEQYSHSYNLYLKKGGRLNFVSWLQGAEERDAVIEPPQTGTVEDVYLI